MGALIGFLLAKLLSLVGIGSMISGFFVASIKRRIIWVIALAIIDTVLLAAVRVTSIDVGRSIFFALVAGAIMGAIGFRLGRNRRHKKAKVQAGQTT